MTPEQFTEAVKRLVACWWRSDPEMAHKEYDALCAEALRERGFRVGVALAEKQPRWYA